MATLKKRKQTANQWWFDFDNLITPASTPNGGSWTRTHVSAGEANEVFVAATNDRAMKTNETSRISQPKHPRRATGDKGRPSRIVSARTAIKTKGSKERQAGSSQPSIQKSHVETKGDKRPEIILTQKSSWPRIENPSQKSYLGKKQWILVSATRRRTCH